MHHSSQYQQPLSILSAADKKREIMAEPNLESSDVIAKKVVPQFTETFPVEDATYPYGAFIGAARKDVIKFCTNRPGVLQPVLSPEPAPPKPPIKPPDKTIPKLWCYAELKTKTSSITLAIRLDNLYLVGFKTPGPRGVWWEFGKNGDTHLLDDNPRWLGFGDKYKDLIGNKGLETVTLGRAEIIKAVNFLARKTTTMILEEEQQLLQLQGADLLAAADPQAEEKTSLAKLAIMVCEGMRFWTVSQTVDVGFNNPHGVNLSELQGRQVQKWNQISNAIFFTWAEKPEAEIPKMKELGIKDRNQAAKIVALVKFQTKKE